MQFKHPEILYTLFLLIIPILVHLFQLRRFRKVAFTNVKFLKEIELQTRKSSNLKKILILSSRLLLFTSLILAFAQPYFGKTKHLNKSNSTYLYLDNSLSMMAKGNNGELFKRAVQNIINNTTSIKTIHLFTNNNSYKNLSSKDLKNTLLSLKYYPIRKNLKSILLKIQSNFDINNKHLNNIILISDFQNININNVINIDSTNTYYITKLSPVSKDNISIDSVSLSNQNNANSIIKVYLKNYGKSKENIAVSLFNKNILSGKSNLTLTENSKQEIEFSIPNTSNFNGKLQLNDNLLDFDNTFYFSIDKPERINITAIGNNNTYLSKIYTENEFNFTNSTIHKFNYNTINQQHLLIFNELETIPSSLINSSKDFLKKGGNLVIIPSMNISFENYNKLFQGLDIAKLVSHNTNELAITSINFSHPLLKGVFEKKIRNFQYPTVHHSYTSSLKNASSIISFENGKPFVSQIPVKKGNVYWFASALSKENSNFKNSPLIVPLFYNFGLFSFQPSQIYYIIGRRNRIEISSPLKKDEVLHFENANEDFIPQQQITSKIVTVTTELNPLKSGFVKVKNKEKTIKEIAYNFNREESDLSSVNFKDFFKEGENIHFTDSIDEAFLSLSDQDRQSNLWKIFVLLALFFLVIETALLKFLKS